jgi:LacI family transcriptional regulator
LCDLAPPNHGHGDVRATLHSLAQRADALIGYFPEDVWSSDQLARRIPSVVLDADDVDAEAASVSIDIGPGIEAALDHFVAHGRKRIGMIDCFPDPTPRRLFYRDYLQRNGLAWSPRSEAWAESTHLGGIAAAARLHEQYAEMDAVLVFNDVMAIGALKSLAHAGVRVPTDCAVIGFDGLEIGQLVTPELSTLELDRRAMARHALDLVDGMLSGALPLHGPLVHRTMTHTLVLRESA